MARPRSTVCLAATTLALLLGGAAAAQEDAAPGAGLREGEVITFDQLERLRPVLPPEFWANRDFFFFEGMRLEIGPAHFDYADAPEYEAASARYAGQARIGPDDSLENHTAGRPFDAAAIDCQGDPQAGVKHMWNFDQQWSGDGADSRYFYSYWDRGEELPLFYQGTSKTIVMAHRVEPSLLEKQQGDLFRGEKRKSVFGIEVDAPFDARGILVLTYRYKASDLPHAQSKNDDTWVYVPTLRRVRRISTAQRTDAVSGTDFTFDDLRSFSGIVPQYSWQCLGTMEIVAPMNTRVLGYPQSKDHDFGPYGLSYANDRWELRRAVKIRMKPKNADHPYSYKDLYLDAQTYVPLYSFAYDQKGELWKIVWHDHRWSEDTSLSGAWYPGWEEVPKPMDVRVVSDIIVNVQTGTGNRIEFWDSHGTPLASMGKVRRYVDVGRLTKGR